MIGSELSNVDVKDTMQPSVENFSNIRPEMDMSTEDLNNAVAEEFDKAAYEMGLSNPEQKEVLSNSELKTSPEKRQQKAQESKGEWSDEPGKSDFRPSSQEAKDAMKAKGVDSIHYDNNSEPDFRPVSEASVKIDNMTSDRFGPNGNYRQAFEKLAEQWNNEAKDNRTDWTARDVDQWRIDNHLTPHERLDRLHVDFVPTSIHQECKHYGGVSECKERIREGGQFDA